MSIAELPSKMLESAASLTQAKMNIACELIKIAYTKDADIQEVVKQYIEVFDLLKDITPPQHTTGIIKRHLVIFWGSLAFSIFFISLLTYFIISRYGEAITHFFVKVIY